MEKKHKIGVSYNIFDDALELLEKSIISIREEVDYINVIYQNISNLGNQSKIDIKNFLNTLVEKKLIDDIFLYTPDLTLIPHLNEINKRNIGLFIAEQKGCTHFMTMDSDEIYNKKEFSFMKNEIIEKDFDCGVCQMLTFYKNENYILDPPEEYFVSLLYKIKPGIRFELGCSFPVLVDPTRRIVSNNVRIFKRDEIQMLHFSYVRNDLRRKLENSSANVNFKSFIDELVSYYENWNEGDDAYIAGLPPKKIKVKKFIYN